MPTVANSSVELLLEKIGSRTASVSVAGVGYVGLTVACGLARAGFAVTGIDIDLRKVDCINRGEYPLGGDEPELPEILRQQVQAGRLEASADYARCAQSDIILIVVQTPVDPHTRAPALDALSGALDSVGQHLRAGTLVVVESTIPPGTMRGLVVPRLETRSGLSAARDFFAACCPERVMPGKLISNLTTCSRVVGGWTPEAGRLGSNLYQALTSALVEVTDCLTAELVKTVENAYRDVQIAFANETALICEGFGANVYAVRELVNKSPCRDMHMPGAGVGGHCIPKDPWLLLANAPASTPVRLIPAARAVNDSMPRHVGELTRAVLTETHRQLASSYLVVLGQAYLANSDDVRNSPTVDLVNWLQAHGASVAVHDPLVPEFQVDLDRVVLGADGLILMVAHDAYRYLDLAQLSGRMRNPVLVDGRHFFDADAAIRAGFTYRCLGIGEPTSAART